MKTILKRICSFLLVAVLILGVSSSIFAEEYVRIYQDVPHSAWYYDAVDYTSALGIMYGVGNGRFAPNEVASRAMFITMLYRLAGSPKVSDELSQFEDVKMDSYYANAVLWGTQNGIVFGVSAARFAPGKDIAREEMACMIARYVENIHASFLSEDLHVEQYFADKDEVSDFAKDAMNLMVSNGLYRGNGQDYFYPRKSATRAEAAMVMTRLALLLEKVPSCATLKTSDGKSCTLSVKDTIWLFQELHSNVWCSAEYAEYIPYYTLTLWGTEYRFAEKASEYNGFNMVTSSGEYIGAQGKDNNTFLDLDLIIELFESYYTVSASKHKGLTVVSGDGSY